MTAQPHSLTPDAASPDAAGDLPPFRFAVDGARKLLVVTKQGYWDMATFDAFARQFRDTLRQMRAHGGCERCLVDASGFAVQSTQITTALQALVESFDPACPRRMAGFTGSQLSKLQARLSGDHAHRRIFSSRAEAEAWLFTPVA